MKILLLGRVVDLTISLTTAIIASFLTYVILPETLSFYFYMPIGMLIGCVIGLVCGFLFGLINVMFNHSIHTMAIGMFSGMIAHSSAKYTLSMLFAFAVWLVLAVSDEYYARITNKVKFELND